MAAITVITGRALPLRGDDLDTDRIMPARFLRAVTFEGLENHLFEDDRAADAGHPFNDKRYKGASILVVNSNFGCGSSREHAAWSLQDYGFDVVIAPSFGDIFFSNSVQIGLVPITLPQPQVKELMESALAGLELTVDLESQTVTDASGTSFAFEMDTFVRHCLMNGLDSIALTLQHEDAIGAFEARATQPVATTAL
jgi:3-isopropylmalate dehydratase small subunit